MRKNDKIISYCAVGRKGRENGKGTSEISSKIFVEDVTTEDAETPSAARKAADEERALRRKPSLIHGTMKGGWNCCG